MSNFKKKLYLDYNATVPMPSVLKTKLVNFIDIGPLNPSSIHFYGRKGKNIIDKAKTNIANLINTKSENIVFTSSATESINLLFNNFENIIVSSIEHLAVINSAKCKTMISVDENGVIDLNHLEYLVANTKDKNNLLLSVMWVNNETGVIQPMEDIIKISRKYNCKIHCDASQALGKLKIDLNKINLDFLTLSGHKIGAPSGIGALVNNKNYNLSPHILGGGQENGIRAGTENIFGIFGFGEVARMMTETPENNYNKIRFLKEYLYKEIKRLRPETFLFGENAQRVDNTLLIALPNVPGDLALMRLDLDSFCVSSGSACSSGKLSKSHVVSAMGYNKLSNNTVRLSFPPNDTLLEPDSLITKEELDRLAQCWSKI